MYWSSAHIISLGTDSFAFRTRENGKVVTNRTSQPYLGSYPWEVKNVLRGFLFWLALASPAVASLVQVNDCERDAIKKILQDFAGEDALVADNRFVGIWGIGNYCDSMEPIDQRRLAWALTSCHCSRENIILPVDATWEDPNFDPGDLKGWDIDADVYEFYDERSMDIHDYCEDDMQKRKKDLIETKEALTSLQNDYTTFQFSTILGILLNIFLWLWATGNFHLLLLVGPAVYLAAHCYGGFWVHFYLMEYKLCHAAQVAVNSTNYFLRLATGAPCSLEEISSRYPMTVSQFYIMMIDEWFPYISFVGLVLNAFFHVVNKLPPSAATVLDAIVGFENRMIRALEQAQNDILRNLQNNEAQIDSGPEAHG